MRVELAGLELVGFHGVEQREQRDGQRFLYDVSLEVGERGASDRIAEAVDYREVARVVAEVNDRRVRPARGAGERRSRRARRALPAGGPDRARAEARRTPGRLRRRIQRGHGRAAVTIAYVGVGSNLGDREGSIRRAAELIGARRLSTVIETEPWGLEDQPRFLNAAAELETQLSARALLELLLDVERRLGRVRGGQRWGPRSIDLDLLLFGGETIDEPGLTVPHPFLLERAFVLGAARRARAGGGNPRKRHGPRRPRGDTIEGVSHLDELDEFEAEAELRLKKEYSAVFGLFRYCVLTQDATYLCNKLDLQYVPQPSYPFFHVRMEDVWVWDKNRPTRMIPRAEVYTSSDVTIEELRGEGDEPVLTAEALAKRIGEGRSEIEDI